LFLGDPSAKILGGKLRIDTKKEKRSKKERKEGLWKLTPLMEIRKERGFPQRLEALRLHSSPRPGGGTISFFTRQRSTLSKPISGPKNGEHLHLR
jgi:hypothetical protein